MGTTNILDLNNRVNALEKAVSGGDSAQANKTDIATEFSTTTAYTAGCFVYYQGKLYQFNADHAAGAWDPTDVVEANVTDQVVSNKSAIDGLTAADIAYGDDSVADALDEVESGLLSKVQCITVSINDVEYPSGRSGDLYAYLPQEYVDKTIVSAFAYSESKAIKPFITYVNNIGHSVMYYTENSESSALTRTVIVTFIIV